MDNKQLIDEHSGSHGVRDKNLLESASETPFQSFGDEELYSDVQSKAARLCYEECDDLLQWIIEHEKMMRHWFHCGLIPF